MRARERERKRERRVGGINTYCSGRVILGPTSLQAVTMDTPCCVCVDVRTSVRPAVDVDIPSERGLCLKDTYSNTLHVQHGSI